MSRKFGKIAQIGYVVRDIDAAMDNWMSPWLTLVTSRSS
jgi:hypothetical protein